MDLCNLTFTLCLSCTVHTQRIDIWYLLRKENKPMRKHVPTIIIQGLTLIAIILYFVFIPKIAELTYEKGVNYNEEYKIKDITKDTVR